MLGDRLLHNMRSLAFTLMMSSMTLVIQCPVFWHAISVIVRNERTEIKPSKGSKRRRELNEGHLNFFSAQKFRNIRQKFDGTFSKTGNKVSDDDDSV